MFSLYLCCSMQAAALRWADPPWKETYQLSKDYETGVKRSVSRMPYAPEGATEIWMIE
jgi:hypothetical protein